MKVVTIIKIVMALIIFGCQSKEQSKEIVTPKYPDLFSKALKAHGGLDAWNSMGTVEFDEITDKDTVNHLVDLKNRNERMEKEGQYIIGYTSDSIYYHPNQSSFPDKDPRFFHNLRFYFFALPFVTADPGANHEVLEPRTILNTECNRVKITFGDEVGFAPKDQYILWFGKKDNLLKMINFSVTYYNSEKAENYNAIAYSKWEDIDGLKVPTEMIGYKWENDTLGDERYRKYFGNISFSKERPDPSVFMNLLGE